MMIVYPLIRCLYCKYMNVYMVVLRETRDLHEYSEQSESHSFKLDF